MADVWEAVRWYSFLLVLIWGGLATPLAYADEREGDIAVTGVGQSRARPNAIQLEVNLHAKSELVEDAMVKFKEARGRLVDRLDKMNIPGLKLLHGGVRIGLDTGNSDEQQMMVNNGQQAPKTEVYVSSIMQIRVEHIRETKEEALMSTISKLMDTIKDAGANLISSNTSGQVRYNRYGYQIQTGVYVRFLVTDVDKLKDDALKKASEDARRSAQRLAALHGVKLGPVKSVQDQGAMHLANQGYPGAIMQQIAEGEEESSEGTPPIVSDNFGFVVNTATVAVRYAIERN